MVGGMTPINIKALRAEIGRHLGQVLTPEVATAIEVAARRADGLPLDISRFAPVEYQGYTLWVERFAEIVGELHPLHVRHWQETEKHRHGLPLNPDYEAMEAHERCGQLLQFTIRKGGLLVGNLRIYLGTSYHSGTPFAVFPVRTKEPGSEEDTLYIVPECRGGFLAARFLDYAESVIAALGVKESRADSKVINKAGVLMRRRGYTHFAERFVKMLQPRTST